VLLTREGEAIDLPRDWKHESGRARTVSELSELTAADIASIGKPEPDPVVTSNPLLPFSLRGQSEKFKRLAIEARPLLGEVCLRGQVTIWYAAPGTGKTLVALSLLIEAVRGNRIAAGNVFYVNADDNGQGFAGKLQIMDDLGGNTLAPGFKEFRAPELIGLLHAMADRNEARGVLVIIDTVKKFASLMDKRESSEFAQACRRVAMMGGSVLGLAHTTKNSNSDGTPRYAGTSDLVDDADAAYTLRLLQAGGDVNQKVVEFRCFKSRGPCAETAA
jgi:RecA-family ATPase